MPREMRASELYALSQSLRCEGTDPCHFCGGKCTRQWLHDDPPPVPFARTRTAAKVPASPWVCCGCWLWRRKRVTVPFLDGGYQDGRTAAHHQWWITEKEAKAVRGEDYEALYGLLLNPPLVFSLSLLEGDTAETLLQLCTVNSNDKILMNTPLWFTVNNIPHAYTVYELEEALRTTAEGKEPGVRALLRLLGKHAVPEKISKGRGRRHSSEDGKILKRVIKDEHSHLRAEVLTDRPSLTYDGGLEKVLDDMRTVPVMASKADETARLDEHGNEAKP